MLSASAVTMPVRQASIVLALGHTCVTCAPCYRVGTVTPSISRSDSLPCETPLRSRRRKSGLDGDGMRSKTILVLLLLCTVGFNLYTLAQAVSTAQIRGTVTDQTGAVVAGAEVRVTQTETGLTRSVTSDANGGYVLTDLPIGHYELRVSQKGFSNLKQRFELQVNVNPTI